LWRGRTFGGCFTLCGVAGHSEADCRRQGAGLLEAPQTSPRSAQNSF